MLNSFAQDPAQIPVYKKELATAKHDTDFIHAYSLLCFNYSVVNTDTALYYGNKAMQLAEKINSEVWMANVKNSLAWTYFKKHDYTTAENLYTQALHTWKKLGNAANQSVVMNNLAGLYMDKTDYSKSLTCMQQVLNLDESLPNSELKATHLHTVGRLYNLLMKHADARKYFEDARLLYKKNNNEQGMANEFMSIANTYRFEKKYTEALNIYYQVIPIFKKANNHYNLGLTYENAGGAYGELKNYPLALKEYDLAIEQYNIIKSNTDMYYAVIGKGDVYDDMKDYSNALSSYTEALRLAKQMQDRSLQYEVMGRLAKVSEEKGDYKGAYQMLQQSNIIKDSLFTLDKQNELLKLQTAFETERKENENQILKAQNEAANTKLQRNTILLFASAVGLLMLGYLVFNFYKNKEAKAKHIVQLELLNKQLNEQKAAINQFNTLLQLKALRAQMNPHFIFNCMSSIQECILTGRIDDANTYLTKLSRLLRMVLNYSDDESITLDKELEMLKLYLALENVRLKGSIEYTIDMDEDLNTEDIKVPTLILQPFAENAIWHGLVNKTGERKLTIKINTTNDSLHCSIEDNGIGRTNASALKKINKDFESKGMKLIEKRLTILKQKYPQTQTGFTVQDLHNDTQESTGTRVEIILPLTLS